MSIPSRHSTDDPVSFYLKAAFYAALGMVGGAAPRISGHSHPLKLTSLYTSPQSRAAEGLEADLMQGLGL